MSELWADTGDVDETNETLSYLVVAGGNAASVLKVVESSTDEVPQAVDGVVHCHAKFGELAHRHDFARFHGFESLARFTVSGRQAGRRLESFVLHDQIKAQIV